VDPSTEIIYFNTTIYNGSINVSYSLDGSNYSSIISDNYGDIKDFNSTTAFGWNEFQYGAYLGIEMWDGVSGSVDYSINATPEAAIVPIPGALWLLGCGLIGLVGLRRKIKV